MELGSKLFDELWQSCKAKRAPDHWDKIAESFNSHQDRSGSAARHRALIGLVAQKTGLQKDGSVLDIGCGSGQFTRELAAIAGEVEAIDVSKRMSEFAQKNTATCSNVRVHNLDWESIDLDQLGWRGRFDLVIASRTPAVWNEETLLKMAAASKKACCIVNMAGISDSVRDSLNEIVGYSPLREHRTSAFYCAANILWLNGAFPEVCYVDQKWEKECSVDELENVYCRFFARSVAVSDEQRRQIRSRLESMAVDGRIVERAHNKKLILTWTV